MLEALTRRVSGGAELTAAEVASAVSELTAEAVAAEVKAGFLSALAVRGMTASGWFRPKC